MRKNSIDDEDVMSKMTSRIKTVCDNCGAVHTPEDEGLRCDCGGIFILRYY